MPLGFGALARTGYARGWAGLRRILGAVFLQQGRAHGVQQLLEAASVFEGAFERWHHGVGNVKATAAAFFAEGQQVVGMFVAPGTRRAVGTGARLVDLGQRALQGGPAAQELVAEAFFNARR